ncbi:MAG: M67 family metallopeptidase [Flavobacteriales bacterium]|nr:M67 family metallopeptidase [Flavobacteriales bacterium]
MSTLNINPELIKKLEEEAIQHFPNECCGFFFGEGDEVRTIDEVLPVVNVKEGDLTRRFQISPLDYAKAEAKALEEGKQLLGIYHTHPKHPAIPSEHDRSQAMPWFSYIILSVQPNQVEDITSWQLNSERQFEEEKIIIK